MSGIRRKWWKEGTAYQIWPASYKDSNSDGIGDIPGIITTLDYLKELGVDIIWLSPAYASPQKDMGYDISNYEEIDPRYGTTADAERLIQECHQRSMRLIFDLVVNHTSDQHAWFKESRSSKDNSKRDWYIWRPPRIAADGSRQPPNNWRSFFGGSVWEWDETTQEYYFHMFASEQPELNWENPETRTAIYQSAIKFWLDKGLDGFRIDTPNMYSKHTEFVDAPIRDPKATYQFYLEGVSGGPRIHEFLHEMNRKAFAGYDIMTVGELGEVRDRDTFLQYVSAQAKEMDMVFPFDVCNVGKGSGSDRFLPVPFTLPDFKKAYYKLVDVASDPSNDGWGTAFLENHDQPRSITRYATDDHKYRARAAKLLAILLCTSSGTLFMYQGQEIGMKNLPRSWGPDHYQDIMVVEYIAEMQDRGLNTEEIMRRVHHGARDHARQPIPWANESPYGGFTDKNTKPWAAIDPEFQDGWNIADQRDDPESVLTFWRNALQVRKKHCGAFIYGTLRIVAMDHEKLFIFEKADIAGFDTNFSDDSESQPTTSEPTSREASKQEANARFLVVLNFSNETQQMVFEKGMEVGEVLLGNVGQGERSRDELAPWEARVYQVT